MKTLSKITASYLAVFFCSIGPGLARNSGAPHPALSGSNSVAQGCHQGNAVGNPHCRPAPPAEIHNEHVIVPHSNQIGGNGGGAQPPKSQPYPVPPNPPEQKIPQPQQYVVPKPIPQGVPTLKPGYQQFPNWTGKRDPDTGYPVPPNPPEQKIPQPQQYAVPKPIPQGVPTLKPGYQQFPNWTGKRDPDTGYPVPPNPPEQKIPQPQQYAVPKPIPQGVPTLKPGYQQFPNWTGKRDPDTGYPVPPNPPEQKIPQGNGSGEKQPNGHKMITRHPGRQPLHDLPQFASADAGKDSFCALSGFYRRKHNDALGNQTETGMLPSLRNNDSMVRDIPAWHEMSSDCLIVVNKRKVGKT